jgi:hypothetical protein
MSSIIEISDEACHSGGRPEYQGGIFDSEIQPERKVFSGLFALIE